MVCLQVQLPEEAISWSSKAEGDCLEMGIQAALGGYQIFQDADCSNSSNSVSRRPSLIFL